MAAITNTTVDNYISGHSTGVTRVTDISTLPVQTDDVLVEFDITATGTNIFATYKELQDSGTLAQIIKLADEPAAKCLALKTALAAIVSDIGTTYTDATLRAAITDLRAITEIRGYN